MIKQQKFGLAIAVVTLLLILGGASFIGGRQLGYSEAVSSFMATSPNAVRRDIQAKLGDFVNAEDFGASQTTNDNTAVINNAVAAVSSNGAGGGCVRLNAGTYRVAGTIVLPSGVGLCGNLRSKTDNGAIGTLLLGTGSSGQILIRIGTGSDNPNFNYVQDIAIGFAQPQSAGASIVVRNGHTISLQRIFIGINSHIGIMLEGGSEQYNYQLEDIEISAGWRGVWIGPSVLSKPLLVQNVTMKNVKVARQQDTCIYLQNVSGFESGVGVECLQSERGLVLQPGNGEVVKAVISSGLVLDSNRRENLLVAPTGIDCDAYVSGNPPACGLVAQLQFVNLWAASSIRSAGVRLDTTGGGVVDGVNLLGPTAGNNFGSGIETVGGNLQNLFITAPAVGFNNVGDISASGISFGDSSSHFSVIGGCVGACGKFYPGIVNKQKHGIVVGRGSDHYAIVGVILRGNTDAGILEHQKSTDRSIVGNIGDHRPN